MLQMTSEPSESSTSPNNQAGICALESLENVDRTCSASCGQCLGIFCLLALGPIEMPRILCFFH